MNRTSLVIMAAGIGSRYGGGIKQMEPLGPSGEIMMDYAIRDALDAGFNRVVFIIRKDLDEDFRELIGNRIEKVTEVAYAYQELDDLPSGFAVPEGRTKPWGTGQALLVARDLIHEPFAVINADDYYGKEAYRALHDLLVKLPAGGEELDISMCAFVLKNTLSDNGGVTRGILCVDEEGNLTGINETKNIIKTADGPAVMTDEGTVSLDGDSLVSMNMWGMTPAFLALLSDGFRKFLEDPEGDPLRKEYLLPDIIDRLIKAHRTQVKVLRSDDVWFGMTYREDRDLAREEIARLIGSGLYKSPLF